MPRSLKVVPAQIEKVKLAYQRTGLPSQQALATELGKSLDTIRKFLNGKAIDRLNFIDICKWLGLEWEVVSGLGSALAEPPTEREKEQTPIVSETSSPLTLFKQRQDWGEAFDVSIFYGRTEELDTLKHWVLADRCRLVALLGMGGMGKTALSIKLAQQIQAQFDYVFWRSLREAPPLEKILADCIKFLSNQQELDIPKTIGEAVSRLIHYLKASRCLLVLDNAESILQGGAEAGRYREGYEDYGTLLQRVGESLHQSCLIITSREKPKEIARQEGRSRPVRSFPVQGLGEVAGQEILKAEGISDSDAQWKQVIDRYAGNPLALKIAASSIQDLFRGNIDEFLAQGSLVFDDIRDLLEQQFERLSEDGQSVMYWLAINREPTTIAELQQDLLEPVSPHLQGILESLRRRSLIERVEEGFTLQNVVMEYLTERLISQVSQEIETEKLKLYHSHALIKATSKDYVYKTQVRLILKLIVEKLTNVDQKLSALLEIIRRQSIFASGYAAGNLLNLSSYLNVDISGYDFSHLTIRQADLKGRNFHHISFANAHFVNCVLTDTFGSILSVAFSPDGMMLATGDTNGEIKLWQTINKQHLATLQGHMSWVRSLVFSPDGQMLASGSEDYTIRLWDLKTYQCVRIFHGHTNWVYSVAFSPDGQMLASGSEDHTVRLWDLKSNQCVHIFQGHTSEVRSVAFSPDGQMLASGSEDHTVRLWDLKSNQCVHIFQEHSSWVYSIAFSPNGQMLASGSADQTIRLWDLKTYQCVHIFEGHVSWVYSLVFSPDGQMLASGGEDHTVRLWDLKTYQCVHIFQEHSSWVYSIAFSPSGQMLTSGSADHTIRLWDLKSNQSMHIFQGYTSEVRSVAFSPDGQMLASGSEDHTVRLWDLKSNQCVHIFEGHASWVYSVAFSPNGQMLASGGADQTIRLWDLKTYQCVHIFEGHTSRVQSVAFSPDGQMLASGSEDQTIRLWDLKTYQCVQIFQEHSSWVYSIAFSPNGQMLASGSADHTIRLWDLKSCQCVIVLHGHASWIRSVAFSPDGQTLASGSEDQTIRLWDLNTYQCLNVFQGQTSWIRSVAFNPDGKTLVSSSHDQTIRFWDAQTGECLVVLRAPRPYEGTNITGTIGLTKAQKASMLALGAVDENMRNNQHTLDEL